MGRYLRLWWGAAGAAVLALGCSARATAAADAPLSVKPLRIVVADLDCLNRDGRGAQRENRKFFADLLVQALKRAPNVRVEHIDAPAREFLADPRARQQDLAVVGDYLELLNGNYRVNIRVYDTGTKAALGAWSAEAPSWRGTFFESKEDAGGPVQEPPALKHLADEVRESVHTLQVWRAMCGLRNPKSGLKAEVAFRPARERYPVFDILSLTVTPNQDAYVTVLALTSTGGARVLFPRPKEESPLARKNQALQVPGPGLTFRVTDQVGSGEDCFKVLLTKEPLPVDAELFQPGDAAGVAKLLEGIAGALKARPADAWGETTSTVKVVDR